MGLGKVWKQITQVLVQPCDNHAEISLRDYGTDFIQLKFAKKSFLK